MNQPNIESEILDDLLAHGSLEIGGLADSVVIEEYGNGWLVDATDFHELPEVAIRVALRMVGDEPEWGVL